MAARISALLAGTALFTVNVQAQSVGTAAAVNPTTEGVRPGQAVRVLRLGSDIISNERISTSPRGSTQILFVDKTTLNIGPGSSVVIDQYVFNPKTGTGQAAITLGKGIMRFVGGEISHSGGATLKTPVATVGIRGGMGTIEHTANGGTIYLHHYGTATISNSCGSVTINRPGFSTSVEGPNQCPTDPEKSSKPAIDRALALLTSGPGQSGGGTFTGQGPETVDAPTYDLPPDLQKDLDDLVREAQEDVVTGDQHYEGIPPSCTGSCTDGGN